MGFSRQEYWNGLPCPPPGNLPEPGIKPASLKSPALAGRFFTTSTTWEAQEGIKRPLISQCCLLTVVLLRSSNSECYMNLRCKGLVMQEADHSFHSMKWIIFHSLEVLQKVKKKEGRRVGRRKEGRKGSHNLEKLLSLDKFWGLRKEFCQPCFSRAQEEPWGAESSWGLESRRRMHWPGVFPSARPRDTGLF